MCRELKVSRQGYYAWKARQAAPVGPRAAERVRLGEEIKSIFAEHRGRYGAPRVWIELRRRGWQVGMNRVAAVMAELGLVGRSGRRRAPRTTIADPAATPAPERLGRDFAPAGPDRVWVTDITYLRVGERWWYLAAILDCHSRLVVGWSLAEHMRTELCLDALAEALHRRRPPRGLLHHSDRGSQYTSNAYQEALAAHGMVSSMSRKGNCWDNAVAESFWATLKRELTDDIVWESSQELETALFEYIEVYYNRKRLHSSLDYMTPQEYDDSHKSSAEAA